MNRESCPLAVGYDSWGRQVSCTNTPAGEPADTSTTTFDALGQIVQVADGNGTTEFTYDGLDALGTPENRGLVTKVTQTSTASGVSHTATAAYDPQGAVVVEKLPAGITRRHTWDAAGELIDLTYTGPGTDPDTGQPVTDSDWFGWSSASDAAGRTVREWSPAGGSAYETTSGVQAVRSDRLFSYDPAGRLVQVDDLTGVGDGAVCQRRGYGFDVNGNRTSQSVATNPGPCSDTGATSSSRVFNAADQPTTPAGGAGAYSYDPLGRQTLIPAADTTNPAGNITVVYDHTDAARTISQGTTSVAFTLDGAGRRLQQTTTVNGTTTGVLTRHYTDSGDNPTWSVDTTDGQTVTTRYAGLTGDGLGVTFTSTPTGDGAELTLTGLRGDIAATVALDGATPAGGIGSWTEYTEYGQPATANPPTVGTSVTPIGYGWLGGHQRATLTSLGITLMGARLYNQATALFTSPDPVNRGGDTCYGYPTDPVNDYDLSGAIWTSTWSRPLVKTVCAWGYCRTVYLGRLLHITVHISAYEMDFLGWSGAAGAGRLTTGFYRVFAMRVASRMVVVLGAYAALLYVTHSKFGRYGVDIHFTFYQSLAGGYTLTKWYSTRGPAG